MPYDEARARLELARRGVSRDRAGHLDRAASLLGELGALDDRQAVERARPI